MRLTNGGGYMNEWRPSVLVPMVLRGQLQFEDAPAPIQSACRLHFYQGACAVLDGTDKAERRAKLDKIPAEVRPHVAAEAQRIWALR